MSLGRRGCGTATDLQPPLLAEGGLRRTCNSFLFLKRGRGRSALAPAIAGKRWPRPAVTRNPTNPFWTGGGDQQGRGGGCRAQGRSREDEELRE